MRCFISGSSLKTGLTAGLLMLLALPGLTSASQKKNYPYELSAQVGYIDLKTLPVQHEKINAIRLKAIQNSATELGAKGGLAWRSVQINRILEQSSSHLDQVFSFSRLLINHAVLPPVIVSADNELNLNNNDSMRLASKTYRILSPARLITTPPNWRDYLWMPYPKPQIPNKTLLPKTQAEATVWNDSLAQGWHAGLKQGDAMLRVNLDRLKRDYIGMVLFKKLLAKHMVSAPHIAKASLGITGNQHNIRINDQIIRITDHSVFDPSGKGWKPIIVEDEPRG